MTDYYKELNIETGSSLNDINGKLTALEKAWERRVNAQPENASKKLSLIAEAREVFRNETTRSEYDAALKDSLTPKEPLDPDAGKLEDGIAKARKFVEEGSWDLAQQVMEQTFKYVNDNNATDEIYHLASAIYYNNQDYDKALAYLDRAIIINDNPYYYYSKSCVYCAKGSLDRAVSEMEKAMARAEKTGDQKLIADGYGILASWLSGKDDKTAVEHARRSIEAGGDQWGFAKRTLDELEMKKWIDQARELLNQSNALVKYRPSIDVAKAKEAKEALEKALTAVNKSNETDEIYALACEIYIGAGESDKAMEYLDRALACKEKPEYYYVKAYYYEYDDSNKAIDTYKKGIDLAEKIGSKTDIVEGCLKLADCVDYVARRGQASETDIRTAEEYLKKAIAAGDPKGKAQRKLDDIKLNKHMDRAWELYENKSYGPAKEALEQALVYVNEKYSDIQRSLIYNKAGIIYYKNREYRRALSYYDRALACKENPVYYYNKAFAYSHMSDSNSIDLAISEMKKCIACAEKTGGQKMLAEGYGGLADCLWDKGDKAAAEKYAKKSMAVGGSQLARNILDALEAERKKLSELLEEAELYYNKEDYSRAKSAIEQALRYVDRDNETAEIYSLASRIYMLASPQDCDKALKYINRALALDNGIPNYYRLKAKIYHCMSRFDDERSELVKYVDLAREKGDRQAVAEGAGRLASAAFSWQGDEVADEYAEYYAEMSLMYGDEGEADAKYVLGSLKLKREQQAEHEKYERDWRKFERDWRKLEQKWKKREKRWWW